ncbi:chloride channel protein [Thiohalorhabdus sp. Cl-TMA]|uniref:Chloride channel protein n=1 Tax=Thiohalorhabdus methylotrophus TaxID=3242694 RepID=A0ABV4TPJ8_9GAMM
MNSESDSSASTRTSASPPVEEMPGETIDPEAADEPASASRSDSVSGPTPPPVSFDAGCGWFRRKIPAAVQLTQNARLRLGLLAILVGIIAGLGAVAFRAMIALVHNLTFYGAWSLEYDANLHAAPSPWGAGIILVPVAGALVVAFLVKNFAPEAKGHGVPEVDDAIYYGRGIIRPMVAFVKSLASSISIGTGAAIGREGPIIQIGAAFGSTLGQVVRMQEWQRITLIACGVAGGIAATFNTPLGALLFTIELTLPESSGRTLVPVALATGAATFIGRMFFGLSPAFDIPEMAHPALHLMSPGSFLVYILFGVLLGLMALAFIRVIYRAEDLFDAIPGGYYVRHPLGMLLVGILMYVVMTQYGHYYIQGVGYATIQDILSDQLSAPLLLITLFAAKLLATSLTLGSGASGGVFSPSLYLGAALGAAYGVVVSHFAPGLHLNAANMAVVGMAGMVGGATSAVLTSVVMIFEMTRNYNVIIPLIITVSIAYGVRQLFMRDSIYTFKLTRRGHYIPDSLQTNMYMLRRALDLQEAPVIRIDSRGTLAQLREELPADQPHPHVLLERDGKVESVLTAERHRFLDEEGEPHAWIEEHVDSRFVVVGQEDMIFDVVAKLRANGAEIALLTRDGRLKGAGSVVGILTLDDIARCSNLTRHILATGQEA